MLENPYQSPLSDEGSPPQYRSRWEAARSGALHGSLWAAKWAAMIGGAGLAVLLIGLPLLGIYGSWRRGWRTEDLMVVVRNFVMLLVVAMVLLIMMILVTASTGALVMSVREAIRFRKPRTS
ncbi:MAG TPA: hypothetical protein VG125_05780 [Pirellulales bacterium]|jgi:hypothetical protein|nr:hypothetical protein [Pirellulales bacterium]